MRTTYYGNDRHPARTTHPAETSVTSAPCRRFNKALPYGDPLLLDIQCSPPNTRATRTDTRPETFVLLSYDINSEPTVR